jgi:hypothetical protein
LSRQAHENAFYARRTVAISLQATKQRLFALVGGSRGESALLFLSRADNESLKRDAASKHLRRESHARQIFVCAAMANGKFDGARINAAATSDTLPGA